MRVVFLTLLILLLAVCVKAGSFSNLGDKVKKTFGGEGSVGEKLKNITKSKIEKIKKIFGSATIMKIREKLSKLKDKAKKVLELSPRMLAALKEKLAVNEMGDSIEEVNQKSEVDGYLFQSDIVLTEEQAAEMEEEIIEEASGNPRGRRQAFKDRRYPATIWENGVNYYFDYNTNPKLRSVFKKGADEWQKNTCINFKEDKEATDKIRVFYEKGCWSFVGRRGGKQDLSLGKGCDSVATATHELGHALGFYHTMARHDRDKYVTINVHNIKPDLYSQFTKQTTSTNENYNITYDYGSIMNYGGSAGSYNGENVIVPHDTLYQETLGSPFLAFYEILMMNTHYNCLDQCKKNPKAAQCKMGGYPNPRDCTKCICPSGYGGPLCDQRPHGCGHVVQASKDYQNLVSTIGNPNKKEQEDFEICNYWIESPPGTQIEVRIDRISGSFAVEGCRYFGVEINTQKDQLATGYRFLSAFFEVLGMGEVLGVTDFVPRKTRTSPFSLNQTEFRSSRTVEKHKPTSQSSTATVMAHEMNRVGKLIGDKDLVTDGKPGPKVTTPRPTLPPGQKCEDSVACSQNICKSKVLSKENKMGMCPKLCGFC
ncbi:hypothetical protein Y032_0436g1425 [Ancylostoma ceylanicum]|uniref:Metalloendopeptidase n=2 Tax=Ancylostoma ceylanicum TaxID=53326 RepID=A0A016WZC4_9BILA|nr:hypothetical protein Y032_0436g1425 [Ancylostoma ceylanicum]